MRYEQFRDVICRALRRSPGGLTWTQLRERLKLPYERPCPSWVGRIEREEGLTRRVEGTRAKTWSLKRPRRSNVRKRVEARDVNRGRRRGSRGRGRRNR